MATAVQTLEPEVTFLDGVTLTENAASKLSGILEEKGQVETHGLRVFVQGGGCGGMQYGMTFESTARPGDQVYQQHGMKVYVDPTSLFYINGAVIDYKDSLMGGGFSIENPQAVSSCGCGSSFRTKETHTGEAAADSCGYH
ncbi:MAG: iron-sulfur cluster assembly accessory protein [Anaerolineales bacterium]|nr:iron-sulfur cluster assembly accessory protein [Anaerolineales bacterium]